MKKLIAYILALVASVALADPPAPFPIEINSQSRVAPEVWTFRNNVRTFRATFKDGTNEVSLVGATPFMSWSTNENASGVVTSSWALVNSGTNGIVDFTFTEAALNYATITNVYEIGVAGSVAVYNRGRFLIKPSPYSTGTNMPVFTTNQNLTGYSFSGQPWIENLTLTTGGAAYVWSGTGTTRNLNVPTNTGSSGSGSGITTNVKVGASSSTRLVVSNGASAEVTMVFDATGLSTGTPLYVESFTGSVGSLSGVATGTPLYVEAFTGSVGSLSGVATGSPLYVESFTGSVGSLSGVATGSPIYSIAGLATGSPLYVEAFTGSVGSLSGVATGSPIYSIAGLATGTPLYVEAFTGSVGSLSGVATGTPIYSVAGLATGTPLYVDQFTGSVGSVVGLATGTPLYVEADTAAIVRVTGLGVVVTNNAGAIITNFGHFTTLNGSAVSKTSTVEQVMVSSLQSYGTFSASTNLIAANTNIVGGEKLTNGTFTGSEANWSLTSSTYNANNVIVLPGATATITYTGTIASVKGKAYQVSWMSTPANGTDFTTYKVSLGGVTNNIGTCPTSTVTKLFGPLFTDQPLQFVVAPGTNQLILDTVSVKEDTDGDLIVADDASIGGRLVVAESISTTGSVTAASFSGGNTGYLALVTGGAVLGQTVVSNNFLSGSYNIISAGGVFNAIVGGIYNRTEDDFSFIGGGYSNIAEANYVGVIAGRENNINGDYSAIIAGKFNMVGGENSVAIGGRSNVVNGTDSIGAGVDAVAGYTRSFVWSDGMTNDFGSTASNQFAVHASGGIRLAGGPIYGDGTGLSNLPAGSITGALPAIDGSLLTGVIAAGTNSVSAIKVSEATNTYVGTVPLNSSATIQFSATATGPTASVLSGALTGINGAGVTGPVAITSLQAIPVLTVAVTSAESTWDASTKTLTLDTNDSGAASGVTLLNGTNGSVTIDAGSNIAVTRTNGNINIAGSAGGSGATQAIATVGSSTVTSTISGATLSWSNAAAASGGASVYAPYATNSIAPTGGSHTVSAATKDSAILSGINHTLSGWGNVILGGWNNKNDALFGAVVGGGYLCGISNGVYYSATLGGVYSYILSDNSYVGPGESCRILATSPYSVVGGGLGNYVAANSAKSVVGGGQDNIGGAFSVTAGGQGNSTAGGTAAAVSGGANNLVDGSYSSVAGGRVNVVHANHSFVGGGDYQTIDSLSHYSAILGGGNNSISNSAKGNIVLGGYNNNVATGVEMSVVWGERANAKHSGSFVLADNRHGEPNGYTDAWETVSTIQSNEFIGRFKNGMHLTPDGDGTTNRWDVTGLKIVTNANVFLYAPGWVGSQLLDVGSNRVYYALGMTTNDWKGTNLN